MRVVNKGPEGAKLAAELIKVGELVCSPTDTLYGLLGSALKEEAIKKVYSIKGREREKPLIVLFNSLKQAQELGVIIPNEFIKKLEKLYPAPVTIILPLKEGSPLWKVFKRSDIGIRIPNDEFIIRIIDLSTPVFAPSANPSGMKPARGCKECMEYFNGKVPLCIEGETLGKASTIVSLLDGKLNVIREGAFPVKKVKEVLFG